MKDDKSKADAKFYKIFGKNIDEFIREANSEIDSTHKHYHSNNAFCGSAGPEEMERFESMVAELSDSEVLEIAEVGGLSPTGPDNVEDVRLWLDEVGREDFYKVYNRRHKKKSAP